ncbi:MAG: c-type cytochrome biogenesis protein CcsB [Proteobacteria bacterium]|jgi:cytochrome c-type biogenesis protein CcsB|nr:c-type cytochrome biogenesis protein CcsB [Desulfocapsa sp.]MBU3946142.1 c-type cytochrome biogenesis protein CcsB [Pseudomonadota bacterium]MCG2742377.1 c-type cytochrome biogenesis protein CcsB [Desulfobacteraceae bacterium]MBU3984210.1 c-type cytochrome biogenesis protein CcsB [Pseudomonadota bacterium]MBU4027345.1 c-type cytochrome biogenesis protein CcsB [Pseudomonadota bacterium]
MMGEISYLLFQALLAASCMALVFYGVFFVKQKEKIRTVARLTLLAAGVLQTLYILFRYLQSGYTPITSQHETIVFFAWSVTWAFLSFRWRYTVKNFGTFISLLVFILLLIAAVASRAINPLPPALQSWWLPVHAGIAVISYGFLALAFCGGIMYLLQEHELKSKRFGYFFTRLPSLESLDQLNSHCLATGFVFLTMGIITGSIWARQAWGTYWHWDPKETWSLITWFLYAAQIHQRFSAGWRGKRAAIMAVIGFASVLFTLWGVTYLLGGIHSYAQ